MSDATTIRRITVEEVQAAQGRHPEVRLIRRRWVGRAQWTGRLCACPASLLAIDGGVAPEQIAHDNDIIWEHLGLDHSYLHGFAGGVDGTPPHDHFFQSRSSYYVGRADGCAVAAALFAKEAS